jgi:hypothetical protein
MSFIKTIQTPSKFKRLQTDIMSAANPRDYLRGIVLTIIGENSKVSVESRSKVYENACDEIEKAILLYNNGVFMLNNTMITFAFAILEKTMNDETNVELSEHSQFSKSSRKGLVGKF